MKTIITLLLIITPLLHYTQGETCDSSTVAEPNVTYNFCTSIFGFDFYANDGGNEFDNPTMDNTVTSINGTEYQCHIINYDEWFSVNFQNLSGDGYFCLHLWDGTCAHPDSVTGNYGPMEGFVMVLWQGAPCDSAQLIWSTNCYWMTYNYPAVVLESNFTGIDYYDPTRQLWYIDFYGMEAGQYYVQIDTFGWCEGCGKFRWCEEPIMMDIIQFEIENGIFIHDQINPIFEWSLNLESWLVIEELEYVEGWNYYRLKTNTGQYSRVIPYWHEDSPIDIKLNGYNILGQKIK